MNLPDSQAHQAVAADGGRVRRGTAFGLVLAMLAALVSIISTPQAAVAAGNQDGVGGHAYNTVYAYVRAGESLYTEDNIGAIAEPDGTTHTGPGTYGPATQDGAWQVRLPSAGTNVPYDWTVDVLAANGDVIPGRAWVSNMSIVQSASVNADLEYWVVNNTGYVYEMTLNGYNGVNSVIQANSVGVADEDCAPTYASYEYDVDGIGSGAPSLPNCGEHYRLFYEEPAADLPPVAQSAEGDRIVLPELLETDDLIVDDLAFTPANSGAAAGTFTYSINPRFTGGYFLQVDVDGNGSYDDAADRSIELGADGSGSYSYEFDGLDGNGEQIADCTSLRARIFFDKLGEIHVVQSDVEARTGGISITRLNGAGAPDPTIYWNDEGFVGDRVTVTDPIVGDGIDSTGGVHGWDYDVYGWGNGRLIDDWAYLPADFGTGEIEIAGRCVAIEKTSNATEATRVGDTVTYAVTATNAGDTDYTEDEPATVFDDLSGVLDDGTFNEDALASRGDAPTFIAPSFLRWTGALPAGESVQMTYTVTLTAGGDGTVRNVAWAPEDPPEGDDPPTSVPACDPPDETGHDPETGELCAEVEYELPQLTIAKSSDVEELPEDGGVVNYTVTITNEGPGATTADDDPVIDDLSEVLDDATLVDGSPAASTGEVAFDPAAQELAWTGALAAGDSAEVTYQVTYDSNAADGDHVLLNVACLPVNLAQNPTDPCRQVEIPGAALDQWKTADPESGSSITAGDVVTYTLHFANSGETAATVDTVDDLSGVLDDADLVDGSLTADDGLAAAVDGEQITVTGSVPVGEELTVTYQVQVREYAEQGDHVVGNVLDCADDDPRCATEHPIRNLVVDKSATPEDGVQRGDVVAYTITVTNNGAGDYTAEVPASITDDLSGLLDDATYNGDVGIELSGGSAVVEPVVDGNTLTWSGPLQAGEVATITYSVTVTSDGDHGLDNVVCETDTDNCADVQIPVPDVDFAKSSDPDSGEDVVAGQVISYTLTFTNDGEAVGVVDSVDDLTEVLDDGDVTSDPVSSSDAVTATLLADSIRVVGEIQPGETVTVSYQVTVRADGQRGDDELINVLVPDNEFEPPVPPVEHRVPELVDWKTVDPDSGTTVPAGSDVVYTLHFRNDGAADAPVDREDVLTEVLDDATITTDPASSDGALSVSEVQDGRLSITGSLAPGQEVTVSYTVTVNADGERGDDRLGNFLVDPGQDPPTECVVEDGELPDCTVNHVSDVGVVKSADPESGTEVDPGQDVTYTLTFTNSSSDSESAPAEVDYTDYLDDVLDDASLTTGPDSSDPALTATATGATIRIVGTLAAGQVATITYTVTVADYDDQANHHLGNVVAVTGQDPVCTDGSPLCTEHDVVDPPAGGALPSTGADQIGLWALAAFAAFAGGIALLGAGRRRNARIGSGQSTNSTL